MGDTGSDHLRDGAQCNPTGCDGQRGGQVCVHAGQRQGTRRRHAYAVGEVHADGGDTLHNGDGHYGGVGGQSGGHHNQHHQHHSQSVDGWEIGDGELHCRVAGQGDGQCDRNRQQRGNLLGDRYDGTGRGYCKLGLRTAGPSH